MRYFLQVYLLGRIECLLFRQSFCFGHPESVASFTGRLCSFMDNTILPNTDCAQRESGAFVALDGFGVRRGQFETSAFKRCRKSSLASTMHCESVESRPCALLKPIRTSSYLIMSQQLGCLASAFQIAARDRMTREHSKAIPSGHVFVYNMAVRIRLRMV